MFSLWSRLSLGPLDTRDTFSGASPLSHSCVPLIEVVMKPTRGARSCAALILITTIAVVSPVMHQRHTALADAREPRGAAAMASFDRLPYFREGTTVHQVSSFDRTGGNDDDSDAYLYRHPQTGGYVVLQESGPVPYTASGQRDSAASDREVSVSTSTRRTLQGWTSP